MFTDPLAATIGGAAKSIPRVGSDENSSVYRLVETVNGSPVTTTVILEHKFQGRNRCVARIEREAFIADPALTGQNKLQKLAVTVTADWAPEHAQSEPQTLFNGLLTFLTSANFLRLANGET
jgi:hypothetical protein